jgi:hypothetical protein
MIDILDYIAHECLLYGVIEKDRNFRINENLYRYTRFDIDGETWDIYKRNGEVIRATQIA